MSLTLERLDLAPWAFEGAPRRHHGTVDIGRVTLRDRCQDFAGGRIDAVERLAGGRRDPLAVDQQQLGLSV
jgi:hypothetical protein